MQISATGNRSPISGHRPERERGFTLTELMVVLVILGIAASAVVFVMPDPRGTLIDEGEAFAARAHAAQETAIIEMQDIALWVSPSGYGFERHDGEAWTPIAQPPFEDRQWADGVSVTVAPQDGERTRIIFDATGLNGPLDVILARGETSVGIAIGADGTIRVDG